MASLDDVPPRTALSTVNAAKDTENLNTEPSTTQELPPTYGTEYPNGMAVVLIMASVWLAFFLVALVSV